MLKVAILGAGRIAVAMANTLNGMETAELYAVASRDLDRAQAFADQFGAKKAYGSYEEMLQDPDVDLVYLATPHSHHYEHAKLCIAHKKNVLCEKAFCLNAVQAAEVLKLAEEAGVLITEAIWTRYQPARDIINKLLEDGTIGTPLSLYADLSYPMMEKERVTNPALGGSCLLDIGIYCLNFAFMVFGNDYSSMHFDAVQTELGVDLCDHISILYKDGKTALLHSDARVAASRDGQIYGTEGYLRVININNPSAVEIYNKNHELVKTVSVPPQITGYEYEVEACRKAIAEGALECPEMPHRETIRMMQIMDGLRAQIGLRYPTE